MKPFTKLTLLLCLLLASTFVHAQTHVGNLTLTTQAQVNAFNYTEVTGDLEITGADISDLSPLSGVTTIGGWLNIWQNPLLQTIDAFNSLTSVGATILIDSNGAMTSFTGFSALQTVGNVFPATWGFIATTTNSLDFNGLYPLLICLFLSAITVAIRLYQHSRA